MNFLWPLAWGLAALAIPVIAFYLIRTRLEQKPVSTLLFWRDLAPQLYNHSLWRRLRRWISLALQLLFLLLLVFALTRPFAGSQSARPVSLVVVLDASASMNATDVPPSRWAEALRIAERRIAQMRFFDEAVLILAADSPRVLSGWTRNKRALQRALQTAPLPGGIADIRPALALARDLAGQRKEAQIFLVSDGVWPEAPEPELMQAVNPHWIGGEAENTGLTLFGARRSLAVPGEYQLLAKVIASRAATASLEIRRDGRLIDVRPLALEAGKPWQQTWDYSGTGAARFEARLTGLKHDDLAEDNRARTSLGALRPVRVEVVSPPNAFLDAALGSLSTVTVHRTWPVENLFGKDGKPAADPDRLYIFHRCLPPDGFRPKAMLVINPAADGFWGRVNGDLASALVSDSASDEPILRFVSLETLLLQKARDITPAPGAKIYAGSFGKPLVFGQWDHEPRWLVLPFGFDDSDLVFRTAFPILLGNLVQSLQPDDADNADAGAALPGQAESLLKRDAALEKAGAPSPDARRFAWWTAWPIWWWALAAGVLWLFWEWWMFSRRITE